MLAQQTPLTHTITALA